MIDINKMMDYQLNSSEYRKARSILKASNLDFTTYSCNDESIARVNDDADKTSIFYLIKKSNEQQRDIVDIIYEEENKSKVVDGLELFFNAFEGKVKVSKRLFLLVGETAAGKTTSIINRYPDLKILACNKGHDPYSLMYFLADKDGNGLKPYPTNFQKALTQGFRFALDEINLLPSDSLELLQGIADAKKTIEIGDETIIIHPDFKLIGTMNPPSVTDERRPLGDALLSRAVGYVMELPEDKLVERLGNGATIEWLRSVQRLYNHIKNSGMTDIRNLDFRDYQTFLELDFETQLKFKVCVGDVENIRQYAQLEKTGEFQTLLINVKKLQGRR